MTNNEIGWLELFLSFHGRIGRRQFWVGVLLLFAVAIGIGFLVSVLPQSLQFGAFVIFGLLATIAGMAIPVKRLHDRNRTGWWIGLPALLGLLFAGWIWIGGGFSQPLSVLNGRFDITLIGNAVDLVLVVYQIWLFIELGFLRGTAGPNRFGDDPLQQDRPLPSAPSPDTHPA